MADTIPRFQVIVCKVDAALEVFTVPSQVRLGWSSDALSGPSENQNVSQVTEAYNMECGN